MAIACYRELRTEWTAKVLRCSASFGRLSKGSDRRRDPCTIKCIASRRGVVVDDI